jgi:hypothetical protein
MNADVISLFSHRKARARNQTNLGRVQHVCKALVRNGRLYLSVHAPGPALTEAWLRGIALEVRIGSGGTSHSARVERLDRRDGAFYLLVSEPLSPAPTGVAREDLHVSLTSPCGTLTLSDTANATQTASR